MKKITIAQLLQSNQALTELRNLKLPVAVAFRLRSLYRQLETANKDFVAEKLEIGKRHGTPNKETNVYEFKTDKAQTAADAEFQELLKTEINLEFQTLTLFDLRDNDVSTAMLCELDWLIVEKETDLDLQETKADTAKV